jgi:hypothetical protein
MLQEGIAPTPSLDTQSLVDDLTFFDEQRYDLFDSVLILVFSRQFYF